MAAHLPSAIDVCLAVVRHGETVENALGRWQGLRDSPLTEAVGSKRWRSVNA